MIIPKTSYSEIEYKGTEYKVHCCKVRGLKSVLILKVLKNKEVNELLELKSNINKELNLDLGAEGISIDLPDNTLDFSWDSENTDESSTINLDFDINGLDSFDGSVDFDEYTKSESRINSNPYSKSEDNYNIDIFIDRNSEKFSRILRILNKDLSFINLNKIKDEYNTDIQITDKRLEIALKILNKEEVVLEDIEEIQDITPSLEGIEDIDFEEDYEIAEESENQDLIGDSIDYTIANDTKTEVKKYSGRNKSFLVDGDEIVFQYIEVNRKFTTLDGKSSFYDSVVKKIEYGSYTLAMELLNFIDSAISRSKDELNPLGYAVLNMNNSEIPTNTSERLFEDGTFLKLYKTIDGNSILIEVNSEDANLVLNFNVFDKSKYVKVYENVPYTETETYGFSKALKDKIKNSNGSEIRFPGLEFFRELQDLEYLNGKKYYLIDTEEKLKELVNLINNLDKEHLISYLSFTNGGMFKKWVNDDRKGKIIFHALSLQDNFSFIIPSNSKACNNIPQDMFNKYMKDIMESRRILLHMSHSDSVLCLFKEGIDINVVEDTFTLTKHLMPYIKDNDKGKSEAKFSQVVRTVEYLIRRSFNIRELKLNELIFAPQGVKFDLSIVPPDLAIAYIGTLSDYHRQVWKSFRPKLKNEQENMYLTHVRFARVMSQKGSFTGIKLDEKLIYEARQKTADLVDLIEELALSVAGETKDTLSISSNQQLSNYIYGKLGVPITEKTKRTPKGELSVDKDVLAALSKEKLDTPRDIFKKDIMDIDNEEVVLKASELNELKYPFAKIVRVYADLRKNLTSYFDGMLNNSTDGIYYPEYNIGYTATWRSTERMQITKKFIKKGLTVFDKSEQYIFSMDYSAEELRLAVNQSEDSGYKEILHDPENDPHRASTARLYNIKEYEVTHSMRAEGKVANFGIIYGMKALRLTKNLYKTEYPTEEQKAVGTRIYNTFTKIYYRLLTPLRQSSDFVLKNGWLLNKLGAMMIYEEVLDIDDYEDQIFDPNLKAPPVIRLDPEKYSANSFSLINKAGNYPIQSWAASILMHNMVKFEKHCKSIGIWDQIESIPLIVHDEFDAIINHSLHPVKLLKAVKDVYELEFKELGEDAIPLFIGAGYAYSWGNAKDDFAEIPVNLQNIMVDEYEKGKIPDIPNEDIYQYFIDRKLEYMKGRFREVLKDVIDSRYFKYADVRKILREEMFVLNQCAELFGVYKPKTGEYKYDKILKLICEGQDYSEEEFTIDEDDYIEETVTKDDVEAEFYFIEQLHPRLTLVVDNLIFNANSLPMTTIKTILKYLALFESSGDKSKNLIIEINNKYTNFDLKINGLPFNNRDIIESIITGDITINNIPDSKELPIERSYNGVDLRKIFKKSVSDSYILIDLYNLKEILKINLTTQQILNEVLKKLKYSNILHKDPTSNSIKLLISAERGGRHIDTGMYLDDISIENYARIVL